MDNNIGAMLDGRYEIKNRIGCGGMADVYKAYDTEECREVAVKVLKNEYLKNDEYLQRFINESRAVAMLAHPNIVKVFDVGFNDDHRYIVMEYIDGITLREHLEKVKFLDWKEAVHLITQILRALQHAHDRGIIHRDIKPQNIMMLEDGTIKVMDFGIAKFTYEMSITATAQTIGSVHYISPEQACGKPIDRRSDIYSSGILLYELVTGQKPFDTENPVTVALMQMNDEAVLPREIKSDIPVGIEEIIRKAIEKEADNRYNEASDMIKDIEKFKNEPDTVFGYYGDSKNSEDVMNDIVSEPEPEVTETDDSDQITEQNYYTGNKKTAKKSGEKKHKEKNDDEETEKETSAETVDPSSRPLFKFLSALTVFVMILVVAGISGLVVKFIKGEEKTIDMPRLIQYDYDDMVSRYEGLIDIQVEGEAVYSAFVENAIVSQSIDEGVKVKKGTVVYVTVSNGKNVSVVPDVSGLSANEAVNLINKAGFSVDQKQVYNEEIAYNMVIRVSPEAGTEMEITNIVKLYVSKGAQTDSKVVPNVVGMDVSEAKLVLEQSGFRVTCEEKDDKAEKGKVFNQSVPANNLANPNEMIILYVSTGNPPVYAVPFELEFPEDAYGIFDFVVYIDDEEAFSKEDVDVEDMDSLNLELSGYDKRKVKVEMINQETGDKAVLGTYIFNFDEKKYETEDENILEVFKKLNGIKPEETTTTTVTTTVITTTAKPLPETTTTAETQEPELTEPVVPSEIVTTIPEVTETPQDTLPVPSETEIPVEQAE